MRRRIPVSKPKRKYFSTTRKPQDDTTKRRYVRKTKIYKTAPEMCTTPSDTGLISVHRLIDSTALAGQELLANNGQVVKSVLAHVASAVHSTSQQAISERNPQISVSEPGLNSNFQSNSKHPFLHSWEYDDEYATSRCWRSRRTTYLALRLVHSDVTDSSDQENLSDDCPLSCFSFKGGNLTAKQLPPPAVISKPSCKRPLVPKRAYSSPLSLYEDEAISAELKAQRKMLRSLEPCVLGYRWPTLVIEEGKVNVASKLSPMMDRETMILWR